MQGATHLRTFALVHLAASFGCVEVVAATIGVERTGQVMLREHLLESAEGGCGAFILDQESRVDIAGSTVQGDDQVERRLAGQPLMAQAVLVQHHADTWNLSPTILAG
ncbi:MAG: hypothetical protein M2R45_01674 [Verrucomicrobia subdivision 3 bacterium]|nr:hypothetical protein [Limisphaerales bacterium]MCS1412824.1 hypothetical protein [Limisphaerales bacterium]